MRFSCKFSLKPIHWICWRWTAWWFQPFLAVEMGWWSLQKMGLFQGPNTWMSNKPARYWSNRNRQLSSKLWIISNDIIYIYHIYIYTLYPVVTGFDPVLNKSSDFFCDGLIDLIRWFINRWILLISTSWVAWFLDALITMGIGTKVLPSPQ